MRTRVRVRRVRRAGVSLAALVVPVLGGASAAPAKGWSIQATLSPARASALNGVSCASRNACTAVGYINHGGSLATLAERWNGRKWSVQPTPKPRGPSSSELTGVSCATGKACSAVGYAIRRGNFLTLAERWNGHKWSIQPTPNPAGATFARLNGVSCKTGNACTAVGGYTNRTGIDLSLVERWNGRKWSIQPTPNPAGAAFTHLTGVSCATGKACTAVGDFTYGPPPELPLAERWNGQKWSIQSIPNPAGGSSNLLGVSCAGETACTAVGDYTTPVNETPALVERWDGHQWSIQPTPKPTGWTDIGLFGVTCPAAAVCTAVGKYTDGGPELSLAEHWDGHQWSIQSTPSPGGLLSTDLWGVSCPTAAVCTAVGEHGAPGANRLTLAERWSG